MKFIWLLLLLIAYFTDVDGHLCSRPVVKRRKVYIYRTKSVTYVKVIRCLYNDKINMYYDISDNCLSAYINGTFTNKYDETYHVKKADSPAILEVYITKVDLLKNEIFLRSGTICRYDRGFCYDPKERSNYAVVWEVLPKPKEKFPDTQNPIFYGFVDLWNFTSNNLIYLFYYDTHVDISFAFRLSQSLGMNKKQIWYTDESGYMISFSCLGEPYYSLKKPSRNFFSLKSKRFVSEAILKDCDLRTNALDVDTELGAEYLVDPENLRIILRQYQSRLHMNNNYFASVESHITKIESNMEDVNYNKSTSCTKVDLNSLLNKTTELETKTKHLHLSEERLWLGLNSLMEKMNSLRNTSDEKILLPQSEFDKTFIKFQDYYNKNHISLPQIEDYISKKIGPQLEAVNKSSMTCLDKIKSIETEKIKNQLIDSLEKNLVEWKNAINEKIHSSNNKTKEIEENLNRFINNLYQDQKLTDEKLHGIEDTAKYDIELLNKTVSNMGNALKSKIESIVSLTHKCSDDITNLKNSIHNSFERSHSDLNQLNISLIEKIHLLEKHINDLASLAETSKLVQNDYKNSTIKKIEQYVNNITENYKNYADNIELNIKEKFKPIIDGLNNDRKNLLGKVNNITDDIDNNIRKYLINNNMRVEGLSKTLNQTTTHILKEIENNNNRINNEERRLSDSILYTNESAKQFKFDLTNFKNRLESLNFDLLKFKEGVHINWNELLENYSKDKKLFGDELSNLKLIAIQNTNYINLTFNRIIDEKTKYVVDQLQSANKTMYELEKSMGDYKKKAKEFVSSSMIITEKNILQKLEPRITSLENSTTKYLKETGILTSTVQNEVDNLKEQMSQTCNIQYGKLNTSISDLNRTIFSREGVTNMKMEGLEEIIRSLNSKIGVVEKSVEHLTINTSLVHNDTENNKHLAVNLENRLFSLSRNLNKIETDVVTVLSKQITGFNQTLEKNNVTIEKVMTDLITINVKVSKCCEEARSMNGTISIINSNMNNLEKNLNIEKVNNMIMANEYSKVTKELENNKQLITNNENIIRELYENLEDSNKKYSKSITEITELKKEIQEIKKDYHGKEDSMNASLKNILELLRQKDDEIMAIKDELKRMSSCCSNNKNELFEKTKEIDVFKNKFIENITDLQAQDKSFNFTIRQILDNLEMKLPDSE